MPSEKFVRYLLIALLFSMFLGYLGKSLSKYNSSLVSVSVREVPQTSFEFPTIAVCGAVTNVKPENMFNPVGAFSPWIEWVEQDYIEEDESDQSGEIAKNIKTKYVYGVENKTLEKMWLDEYIFSEKNGIHIGCNFFRPPKTRKTLVGARNQIVLKLNNSLISDVYPYFGVTVNHPELLLPISYLRNDIILLPSFIDVDSNKSSYREMVFHIDFGEYTYLSRPDRKCRTDKELETVPRDDFKTCSLRFMSRVAPVCLKQIPVNCTYAVLESFSKTYEQISQIGEQKFFDLMNCYPPCRIPTYDIKVMPTISSNHSPDNQSWIQLTMVAPRPLMTQRTEFLVFDVGAMAGDVGGLMGILTGASVLAMYDNLVKLARRAKKYFKMNHK